ncbi:hypothetical protein Ocin01_07003 [Orchesella cincta]|uniref:Uncharacterized protein n=1 Tax=Orchesella cincta TaxID=48709 RepID=A0A1D2N377_ORCCI|nr:hypothetical protein Ocin01_07003 [Orchesella cincta]
MATNVGKSDNNETEEAMDVALPLKEEAVQEENNLDQDLNTSGRTFDGRFFTISSPMAKNTPEARTPQRIKDGMSARSNRSPATSLLRTPSRRLSTTSDSSLKRMSFCILGVRQSMGSFNKIGAVPISADEKNQETENEEMF